LWNKLWDKRNIKEFIIWIKLKSEFNSNLLIKLNRWKLLRGRIIVNIIKKLKFKLEIIRFFELTKLILDKLKLNIERKIDEFK
jgi:hypothetical protein